MEGLTEEEKEMENYYRRRYYTDINHKLATIIRNRLYRAIKKGIDGKHTVGDIGCTIIEFKERKSKEFVGKMTWDNYGEWEIDHRIPCKFFNLENYTEKKYASIIQIFSLCGRLIIEKNMVNC